MPSNSGRMASKRKRENGDMQAGATAGIIKHACDPGIAAAPPLRDAPELDISAMIEMELSGILSDSENSKVASASGVDESKQEQDNDVRSVNGSKQEQDDDAGSTHSSGDECTNTISGTLPFISSVLPSRKLINYI